MKNEVDKASSLETKIQMKRCLIFEGIASSGKTTLEQMLKERLKDAAIISEGQTLMPMIENKDPQKALECLSKILDDLDSQRAEIFIIDRFHLTHAFRTGTDLSMFRDIEDRLMKYFQPLVIFLQMSNEIIPDRIKETTNLRGSSWAKGKQGTAEEKTLYYQDQQRTLMELAKQSNLPVLTIDTSDKDWDRCLSEISQMLS